MPILSNIDVQIDGIDLKGFQQISIIQNLYGIDRFDIICQYDALEKLDSFVLENSKDLLGSPIVIQSSMKIENEETDGIIFKGFVTEVQGTRSEMSDNNQITISGGSSEIILDRKPTNRAYIDKNLKDIVNDVLKPYGFRSKVSPRNSTVFPYIVQYEESDLEFIKRLSIRYGEWFFFDGQEIIFGAIPETEGTLTLGVNLRDLRYGLQVQPVKFSLFSLDPLKSDVYEYRSGNSKTEANLNLYGKHALDRSKELYSEEGRDYYEHLNVEDTEYKKGLDSVGELEEASDAVNLSSISGSSVACFLFAGMNAKIILPNRDGKSKVDYGKFLITSVQHSLVNNLNYSNHFTAIPAEAVVPENTDPYFTKNTSHQLGVVSDNEDPNKLGRVKLSFWWMDDRQTTHWVKVMTPYSFQESGIYFVPAINSKVLVGFEDGDVEKPYCLGTLFDEDAAPDPAWIGNHDNSNAKIHAIRTQSGQTIELCDEKGSERIRIYDTEGKNEIILDSASGEISLKATERVSISAKEIEIKADAGVTLEAGQTLDVKGMDIKSKADSGIELKATNIEVTANTSLKVEGSGSAELSSSGISTVKGSMVKIN